ncbi:MAG: hypothetical protein JXQ91_14305 [Vannielia sp.]|uniref:hypothetical protein n=1 Tax=Vannielia sp. TaxID=2813045 RepID=UPI003B8AD6D9
MPARIAPLALTLLATATAAPLWAADDAALLALRNAVAPGECSGEEPARTQPFSGGTLHALPCRTTAHDSLSVLVLERDGTLQPLFFANPELQFDYTADGALDWQAPGFGGISVSPVVSSFTADDTTGQITISERLAPGLGEGHFTYTHALEDWGMTLHSVAIGFDGGDHIPLWPPTAAEPDLMEELGLAHTLDGFTPEPLPTQTFARPADVAALLASDFPSMEEGRPRLEIAMEQQGERIAMTLLDHGWADDSQRGKAWRVLMEQDGDAWRVTALGSLNICWRGQRVKSGLCL